VDQIGDGSTVKWRLSAACILCLVVLRVRWSTVNSRRRPGL